MKESKRRFFEGEKDITHETPLRSRASERARERVRKKERKKERGRGEKRREDDEAREGIAFPKEKAAFFNKETVRV